MNSICKTGSIAYEKRLLTCMAADAKRADASLRCLQSITGSYTLQPKMQAIVNGFVNISNDAAVNITAAEALASYGSIHPFYLEVSSTSFEKHDIESL